MGVINTYPKAVTKKQFFDLLKFTDKYRAVQLRKMFQELWPRFSKCPASDQYHGSWEGGLLEHTYLVTRQVIELYKQLTDLQKDPVCDLHSLVFCALVHDLGKLGNAHQPQYVPAISKFIKTGYLRRCEHELRSIYWLNKYKIEISDEELIAIYHHAGPYNKSHESINEFPMLVILHSADNLIAKVLNV